MSRPSFKASIRKRWPDAARLVLAVVVLVLAATVWFGMSPASDDSAPHVWKRDAAAAAVDNEANNLRTEGAPQQQVVNGWYTNDLATVALAQNTYIAESNDRNGALIATFVLGSAGWFIINAVERLIRGSHFRRTDAEAASQLG